MQGEVLDHREPRSVIDLDGRVAHELDDEVLGLRLDRLRDECLVQGVAHGVEIGDQGVAACIEAKAAVATSISSSPFRAGGRR